MMVTLHHCIFSQKPRHFSGGVVHNYVTQRKTRSIFTIPLVFAITFFPQGVVIRYQPPPQGIRFPRIPSGLPTPGQSMLSRWRNRCK